MGITYRPEIDGLRAIAVLAVVFYHAGVGPSAGFVGVDIFFVISGYLITSLLLIEWRQTGRIRFMDFYARRARRIVPAALLVVLATALASRVVLPPSALTDVLDSSAAAIIFVCNLFFQSVTGGYFDHASTEMPLLHLWSLSVEEQFYLVWPALLALALYRRPKNLAVVLAILAATSFALAEYLIRVDPEAAFYQTPARFWELSCGGLVATFARRSISAPWLASLVLGGLLASTMVLVGNFPGLGALPAVILSASLLWLIHGNNELGIAGRWLRSWPMVAVGRLSYSFYLWHWPLLALFAATTIGAGTTWARVGLCAVALALAAASYRYVEQPFRRLSARPGPTVAAWMGISLAIAGGALAWSGIVKEQAQSRPKDNPFAARGVEHVHILGPSPEIADDVPKCIRANRLDLCPIFRTKIDSVARPVLRRLTAEAAKYPNVSVIDVSGYFCDETVCPTARDGVSPRWDNRHESATAASAIAERLVPELSQQYALR